jgi:hypothetical protein
MDGMTKYGKGDLETCTGLSLMEVGVGDAVLGLCVNYGTARTFLAFVPTNGEDLSTIVGPSEKEANEKNRLHER